MRTRGSRRRSAASAASARVVSFSLARSASRAACHSSCETTGGRSTFCLLKRWDVLVAVQDVVGVVLVLEGAEALEGFVAERGPDALDRLVALPGGAVAAARERPRLDRRRGVPGPLDRFFVVGGVLPRRHDADVERGAAEAHDSAGAVCVFGCAVQGFEEDTAGRPAECLQAAEELVDELVRELTNEVALPVVPALAEGRVEQALLVGGGVRAHRERKAAARG